MVTSTKTEHVNNALKTVTNVSIKQYVPYVLKDSLALAAPLHFHIVFISHIQHIVTLVQKDTTKHSTIVYKVYNAFHVEL